MVDFSQISAAVTAIGAASEIGKSLLGIRDSTIGNAKIIEIQELLLKAQNSLFAHNSELHKLQQENFDLANRLRALEEKQTKQSQYSLVEIGKGGFVLEKIHSLENIPDSIQTKSYFCQPCFSGGREVVLQRGVFYTSVHLDCPVCKNQILTGEEELQ